MADADSEGRVGGESCQGEPGPTQEQHLDTQEALGPGSRGGRKRLWFMKMGTQKVKERPRYNFISPGETGKVQVRQ